MQKLLQTCENLTRFHEIHTRFITSGLIKDPYTGGNLLKLSLNFCKFDYTFLIFKFINSPDTFCINTLIKSYSLFNCPPGRKQESPPGRTEQSSNNNIISFYFDMLNDYSGFFKPNKYTFSTLISCCGSKVELGRVCHGQCVKYGVDKSLFLENCLIHMYGSLGFDGCAWKVFDEMSERDLVSWNSLVDGYVKVGKMDVAHKVFDEMPERNVVSWNGLMKGYLDCGNPGNVVKLFREMVKSGERGNGVTFVSVVTACGRSRRLKEGRSVHGYFVKMCMSLSLIVGTSLIDMYCRCGRVDVARIIFDYQMLFIKKNLVCWNAMITGECIHGNPENGLCLFDKMLEIGKVIPDEVTFVGVLCACARLGYLSQGKRYFQEMTDVYDVKPNFGHYWCMANIYANQGLVNEAVEFLKNMPSSLWAGFLGLCRYTGDSSVGEQIAKALIDEDPLNQSYYMFLIIIYTAAGRWTDVTKLKHMMKEQQITVPHGFSLLDLTQIVTSLQDGEKSPSLLGIT